MLQILNQTLGVLTIVGNIIVVLLVLSYFYRKTRRVQYLHSFIGKHAFLFSWLLAMLATVGSLYYSEVAHFEPCKLCWYQRIFIYPQTILLGVGLFLKDYAVKKYVLILSAVGGIIAFYQYLLQLNFISPNFPCSAVVGAVSCSQRFVLLYDFVTIPLMSLTVFLLIISLLLTKKPQ